MKEYPVMSGDMRDAVINCEPEIVRALLDVGEDPCAVDKEGMNIIALAAADPESGMAVKILDMIKNVGKEKEMLFHESRRGNAFSICLGREEELRTDGVIGKAEHTEAFDAIDRTRRMLGIDPEMHGVGLIVYPAAGNPSPVFFSGRTDAESWKNKFMELAASGVCLYEVFSYDDVQNGNFTHNAAGDKKAFSMLPTMYSRGDSLVCFDPMTLDEDPEMRRMNFSLSGDFNFRDAVTDIMNVDCRRPCDVFEHNFDYDRTPHHQYTLKEFASDFYNAQYCISNGITKENAFKACGVKMPEKDIEIER